ncbi:transposase [Actinoplanes sp. NPDC051411]|uniref:transposase n=1 Tax=Actinoplanes sp. NPDC051411 TaxID=3155522 RepID=UPI00343154BA
MSAEADAVCGAEYGERGPDRLSSGNGYRAREWDTGPARSSWPIPSCARGSCFPGLVVEAPPPCRTSRRQCRGDQPPAQSLDPSGGETGRAAPASGRPGRSVPQPPPGLRPYTFVWLDALVIKVREHGRTLNVHTLVAVGVNADVGREASACRFPPTRTARAGRRSYAR